MRFHGYNHTEMHWWPPDLTGAACSFQTLQLNLRGKGKEKRENNGKEAKGKIMRKGDVGKEGEWVKRGRWGGEGR